MRKTRVTWSIDIKTMLVKKALDIICHQQSSTYVLEKRYVNSSHVSGNRRFFKEVFDKAQSETLPVKLHRTGVTHSNSPWIEQMILEEVEREKEKHDKPAIEPMVPVQEKVEDKSDIAGTAFSALIDVIVDKVTEKLYSRLEQLVKDTVSNATKATDMKLLTPHARHDPSPISITRVKKKRVLLVGLNPDQEQDVMKSSWSEKFDLEFRDKSKRLYGIGNQDYCFGFVDFISHPTDNTLRTTFGDRYFKVTGTATSAKKALNDLSSKLGY